jgi:hypothetical protein
LSIRQVPANNRGDGHATRCFLSLVLACLITGTISCAAPAPIWLTELKDQIGTATYGDITARWGEPIEVSKHNDETVGVWAMEEIVQPNWSIHTSFRTVVCEKYIKRARMWFSEAQRLLRIEYLPHGERQRLGQANVPLISNIPGARSPFYNYTYDDIRRMCALDLACSRIALERCKMLNKQKRK